MPKSEIKFVPQPLVLISQIQRSGGTLTSQLLDGHPAVLMHPHELHIGRPQKWDWPQLDPSQSPNEWLPLLYEKRLEQFYGVGYVKAGSNPHAQKEVHPFNFDPQFLVQAFNAFCQHAEIKTQRDILNCYFSAFFAAWDDITVPDAVGCVAAFCPRVLMYRESADRLLADYPDGFVLSSIRDPRTWFASSSRHSAEAYPEVETAIDLWMSSTQQILERQRSSDGRVIAFTYEDLVTDTKGVMTQVAAKIGLPYDPILEMPTYLGRPILSNSSYAKDSYGVSKSSLETHKTLSGVDLAYIEKMAMPMYEEARAQLAIRL